MEYCVWYLHLFILALGLGSEDEEVQSRLRDTKVRRPAGCNEHGEEHTIRTNDKTPVALHRYAARRVLRFVDFTAER